MFYFRLFILNICVFQRRHVKGISTEHRGVSTEAKIKLRLAVWISELINFDGFTNQFKNNDKYQASSDSKCIKIMGYR